ncbi:MAG: hypothetical protein AABY22_22215 [Nanoarchaeota archaeon]
MPKVFDCIQYNGEDKMLDVRLNVLDSYVDYFVISECERTFSNLIKPFFFFEQREKFKKFLPKIIYHKIEPLIFKIDSSKVGKELVWNNEWYQRNSIWIILNEIAKPEDIILFSGVDEIPDPNKLKKNILKNKTVYMMRPCYYYINCVSNEPDWTGTLQIKKKTLDKYYLKNLEFKIDEKQVRKGKPKPYGGIYWACQQFGLEAARVDKNNFRKVKKGGWHYQFYGGNTEIAKKLLSYSHIDAHERGLSNQAQLQKMKNEMKGIDPEQGIELRKVQFNKYIAPEYILNNKEKFDVI